MIKTEAEENDTLYALAAEILKQNVLSILIYHSDNESVVRECWSLSKF